MARKNSGRSELDDLERQEESVAGGGPADDADGADAGNATAEGGVEALLPPDDPDFAEADGLLDAEDAAYTQAERLAAAWEETLARKGDAPELALRTLRGDLRHGMMDRLRTMPKPWTAMSEMEQGIMIQSIDRFATDLLTRALMILAGAEFTTIHGLLVKAETKGGTIKTQVDFNRTLEQRHELIDSVNEEITIVLVNRERFMGEREADEPDPDQPPLINPDGTVGNVATFRGRGKKGGE